MKVSMNTVVSMTYTLKDSDGNLLEESTEPVTYLHGGFDNVFPKVEEAIHGKNIGDVVHVDLQPEDAFGDYDEELVQIESADQFPTDELKVGMQFEGEDTESGEVIIYSVTDIADGKVVVDGNHPWAGQRVVFSATITDVRLAEEAEIEHRHVHGEDGQQH